MIAQWSTRPHLGDVRGWVKIVPFTEGYAQATREEHANRALARAGHAHDKDQGTYHVNSVLTDAAISAYTQDRATWGRWELLWRRNEGRISSRRNALGQLEFAA